jgi:hypothetical protein
MQEVIDGYKGMQGLRGAPGGRGGHRKLIFTTSVVFIGSNGALVGFLLNTSEFLFGLLVPNSKPLSFRFRI